MGNVTHAGTINLKGNEVPCYVMEDGTRLISSRQMQEALRVTEKKTTSGGRVPGTRLDRFFNQKSLKPLFFELNSHEKDGTLWNPIKAKWKGISITGYNAYILTEICEAMLKGRREGKLIGPRQKIIAEQCEILLSGFARIGIIALIDEATGYQDVRKKDALVKLLEAWIEQEAYRKWTKTFPIQFYEQIFRLRNWDMLNPKKQRPGVVAKYTDNFIYKRIAPDLLDILRTKNPIIKSGRRAVKHHQWLTGEIGEPRLRAHLEATIALMKISKNWQDFERNIDKVYPRYDITPDLPFDY